jgi:hypothetical protein
LFGDASGMIDDASKVTEIASAEVQEADPTEEWTNPMFGTHEEFMRRARQIKAFFDYCPDIPGLGACVKRMYSDIIFSSFERYLVYPYNEYNALDCELYAEAIYRQGSHILHSNLDDVTEIPDTELVKIEKSLEGVVLAFAINEYALKYKTKFDGSPLSFVSPETVQEAFKCYSNVPDKDESSTEYNALYGIAEQLITAELESLPGGGVLVLTGNFNEMICNVAQFKWAKTLSETIRDTYKSTN